MRDAQKYIHLVAIGMGRWGVSEGCVYSTFNDIPKISSLRQQLAQRLKACGSIHNGQFNSLAIAEHRNIIDFNEQDLVK